MSDSPNIRMAATRMMSAAADCTGKFLQVLPAACRPANIAARTAPERRPERRSRQPSVSEVIGPGVKDRKHRPLETQQLSGARDSSSPCRRPCWLRLRTASPKSWSLKQRGHEETPDRYVRRDGIGVDVYHVIPSRVAPDLLGAQMMGVLRSTAFGLDPRRDRLASSQRSCACAAPGKRASPAVSARIERLKHCAP